METNARYVLIGGFTLVVVAAVFGYILWAADRSLDKETALYDIHFTGPVTGLSATGDVLFNGIKVGQVRSVSVSPKDPSMVLVRIEVDATTPVRVDSVAKLEIKGITGVSQVQISGGKADSPLLKPTDKQPIPVLPSGRSDLAELVTSAPELVNKGISLLARLERYLDEDNRQAVASILNNVESFTATLADQQENLERLFTDVNRAGEEFAQTATAIRELAGTMDDFLVAADGFVDKDLKDMAKAYADLADELAELVRQARPGIAAFSSDGLISLNRFIAEARQLVSTLESVARRIESDSLFGTKVPEYKAP